HHARRLARRQLVEREAIHVLKGRDLRGALSRDLEVEHELDLLRDTVALVPGLPHRDDRRPSLHAALRQRLRQLSLRISLSTEKPHPKMRPTGFEPVAYASGGRRSIQLSYGRLRRSLVVSAICGRHERMFYPIADLASVHEDRDARKRSRGTHSCR